MIWYWSQCNDVKVVGPIMYIIWKFMIVLYCDNGSALETCQRKTNTIFTCFLCVVINKQTYYIYMVIAILLVILIPVVIVYFMG